METLTRVLGETEASRRVIDQFSANEKRLTIDRYPNPPSVFYYVGDPLWTSGGNSFTNELIERAGGKNLFGDLKQKYLSINEEELVKRNPDVIVLVRPANPEAKRAELLTKPTWRTLNAIKNNRIVFLDEDSASRPGPRILDAIRELELALHPQPKP